LAGPCGWVRCRTGAPRQAAAGGSGVPEAILQHEGVGEDDELPHDGGEGDLVRLTGGEERLALRLSLGFRRMAASATPATAGVGYASAISAHIVAPSTVDSTSSCGETAGGAPRGVRGGPVTAATPLRPESRG